MENTNKVTLANDAEMVNDTELKAAENAAKTSSGTYTHTFKNPFVYENKTYTEITFNYEGLTGKDFLEIETEMQALGKALITPEFSGTFLLLMSSRASGVASDVLQSMPFADFKKMHSKARSFLLNAGS